MQSCHRFLPSVRFGALFLTDPLYCMPFYIIFIHYFLNPPLFFIPEDLVCHTGHCSALDPRTLLAFQVFCELSSFFPRLSFIS